MRGGCYATDSSSTVKKGRVNNQAQPLVDNNQVLRAQIVEALPLSQIASANRFTENLFFGASVSTAIPQSPPQKSTVNYYQAAEYLCDASCRSLPGGVCVTEWKCPRDRAMVYLEEVMQIVPIFMPQRSWNNAFGSKA